MKVFDDNLIQRAFKELDERLEKRGMAPVLALLGGGGALIAAYQFRDQTSDVDILLYNKTLSEIQAEIEAVAKSLKLPADWANPYFSTFTIYLPKDYQTRTRPVFSGKVIKVEALGVEDLLIMKFMANRKKDYSHIRFLLTLKPNLKIVEERLEQLEEIFPDEAKKAIELYDELTDEG